MRDSEDAKGDAVGNVAVQCRNCRGWNVVKGWTMANPYYNCQDCGYVWR